MCGRTRATVRRRPAIPARPSLPVPPVVVSHAAARAAPSHNSGVMLLVGALVLLVLVAASLSLLRLANRLHREIMGSAV